MFRGALQHSLWCASALFVVRVANVGCAPREEKFHEKKGAVAWRLPSLVRIVVFVGKRIFVSG